MQFYRRLYPVKAISFDLDDTLYNNVPVMQRAEQAVRDFLAREFPQTAVWQSSDWLRHRQQLMYAQPDLASNMTQLRRTALAAGLRQFAIAENEISGGVDAAFAHFMAHRNAVEITANVHAALAQLADYYPLFALSNGNVSVEAIGLGEYFTGVFQPSNTLRGKPFADMFLAAQQQLPEVAPLQWLHVGDSPSADVLGAQRAGWQSAWFTGGLGKYEHLQVLPTLAYNNLQQLTDQLLKAHK